MMRSTLRTLLVAVVTTLGLVLVVPGIAHAKSTSKSPHTVKSTKTTKTSKTTTKSSKRAVKHSWSKGHAKAHPKPHRVRRSPAAKPHPHKG